MEKHERMVVLNELAQELRPITQGVAWFEGLTSDDQLNALHELAVFCIQAHPTSDPDKLQKAKLYIIPGRRKAGLRLRGAWSTRSGAWRLAVGDVDGDRRARRRHDPGRRR